MKNYYALKLLGWTISRGGFVSFITLLLKIVLSKIFGQHRLVFGTVSSALVDYASRIEVADYEIKEVSSWDMVNQTTRETFTKYAQHIWWDTKSMLREGGTLWLGYLHGQLASIAWTRSGDRVRKYFFPVTSDCIVISHCVTLPQYRGLHLYPTGLAEITRVLADRGFKRFYIACSDWNIASVQAIHRAGFRLLGRGIAKNKSHFIWYQESRPDVAQVYKEDCNH